MKICLYYEKLTKKIKFSMPRQRSLYHLIFHTHTHKCTIHQSKKIYQTLHQKRHNITCQYNSIKKMLYWPINLSQTLKKFVGLKRKFCVQALHSHTHHSSDLTLISSLSQYYNSSLTLPLDLFSPLSSRQCLSLRRRRYCSSCSLW